MKVQSWRSHDGEHVIVISDLTLRAWQRATLALFDVRAELEDEEPTIVRPRHSLGSAPSSSSSSEGASRAKPATAD